ncbi:MAG: transporter substrate-binding domain-containing protein, partial [Muribaculaceae bacterium]|nr:transporter substrate-binding domain-containing protein [Muribaculaceae bacterium]
MKKKRQQPKYIRLGVYMMILILAIVAMTFTRRCTYSSPLPPVTTGGSAGDTIDVAVIYGPLSYYMYEDTLGGVNLDMLREFEKTSNRKLKMWPIVNLHDALDRLEKGDFDMLASLPADNTVKKRFLTTESVFLDRLVLVQLTDSSGNTNIKSALDLDGNTVMIQK